MAAPQPQQMTARGCRGKLPLNREAFMTHRCFTSLFAGALVALVLAVPARAQSLVPDLEQEIRQRAAAIEGRLIAWRRDIHEHPELGEQETRTAALVAEHLKTL